MTIWIGMKVSGKWKAVDLQDHHFRVRPHDVLRLLTVCTS